MIKKRQQDILNALAAIDSQIPTLLEFNDERIQPQVRRLGFEENARESFGCMEQKVSAISAETENMGSQIALANHETSHKRFAGWKFCGITKVGRNKNRNDSRDLHPCVVNDLILQLSKRNLEFWRTRSNERGCDEFSSTIS